MGGTEGRREGGREGGAINNRAGKSWRCKLYIYMYSNAACSFDLRRADIIYTRARCNVQRIVSLPSRQASSTPDNHANYDFPRYFEHVNRPNCGVVEVTRASIHLHDRHPSVAAMK